MSTPTMLLDRFAETLEHRQQHWSRRSQELARERLKVPAVTLAITREAGTPGTSVAREVGVRLDWPVYDHELVEMIAKETGLRTSLLDSVDEHHRPWLLECIEALGSARRLSESGYAVHVFETVVALGTHGHCVIVGRGAAHILPSFNTLRVRLVGLLEDRVASAARQQNLSHEEAARWVEKTDRERTEFVRAHFFKDPTDSRHYDLVLNTSRWSVPECADLIVRAVRQLECRLLNSAG
jgi:cytidylate kinase